FAAGCALLNTVMVTSSDVAGTQAPLEMVQRNVLVPTPRPLTVVVGLLGLAKVPLPATTVHSPLAGAMAALAANVVEVVGVQRLWSGPALAAGWFASWATMVTSSNVVPHCPKFTVHRSTLVPMDRPDTAVVALPGLAKVAEPLTTDHVPCTCGKGSCAAMVADVPHTTWSGPAFTGVRGGSTWMV